MTNYRPDIRYVTYPEAVYLHVQLMRLMEETRFGVFDRTLVESALARPVHSAQYENADIIRQAATLCYGLIKNHPWIGGNKRTATAITDEFLFRNGYEIVAPTEEVVRVVLLIESDEWNIDAIEVWLRGHSRLKHDSAG